MTTILSERCEEVYKLNIELLNMVKEGRWDEFYESAQRYIVALRGIVDNQVDGLMADEKEHFSLFLNSLIKNENEITKILKIRLNVLSKDIAMLQHGKKSSQAYSSQSSTGFH